MDLAKADEQRGEHQLMFVAGKLVITCAGKHMDYVIDVETKVNVYKKEDGWQMLSTTRVAPLKYQMMSFPGLV